MKSIIGMGVGVGTVLLLAPVSTVMAVMAFVLVQFLWPGGSAPCSSAPEVQRDKFADGERLARAVLGKMLRH